MGNTKMKYTGRRKKAKRQQSFCVSDILKNEKVAFLDTEFLTSQKRGGPPARLVSIGFVICQGDFEEVERFHSYIYTEDALHDKFRELTGITEETLLQAPSYEQVMKKAARKLHGHNVTSIFVWGPDQKVIQQDLKCYRNNVPKRTHKIVNFMLNQMKDIEEIYSKKLKMHSIGIANMKLLCGLGSTVSHDALEDAIDLRNVIASLDKNGCPERAVQMLRQYMKEKELYCRYRRFRERPEHLSEAILEKSRQLMQELENSEQPELRALRDDLRVLCTGEDVVFPEPEVYIRKITNM